MSTITKDAVSKALPTLKNIPIVGEYSVENKDFKGHGGKIDLDDYRFIHTTKPYGVVPESATYEWVEVKGRDGATREYLEVDGCYLWTGRYEEASSIIENGKGQSMEIEVTDGIWDDNEESYVINSFNFSALCILGDDVEPAFEDAQITAYSLDRDSFKQEFTQMLGELKSSLSQEKEVNKMLKELLEKYSLKVEDLTAKGIDFNQISEDELEAKIIEVFEIDVQPEGEGEGQEDKGTAPEGQGDTNPEGNGGEGQPEGDTDQQPEGEGQVDAEALQSRIQELETENHSLTTKVSTLETEVEDLRQFKLDTEKADHEAKVEKLFSDFQLKEEDVADIDIHAFSLDEIEEKAYAILGRKMAKKNFSKNKEDGTFRLPLNSGKEDETSEENEPYGGLFKKYKD